MDDTRLDCTAGCQSACCVVDGLGLDGQGLASQRAAGAVVQFCSVEGQITLGEDLACAVVELLSLERGAAGRAIGDRPRFYSKIGRALGTPGLTSRDSSPQRCLHFGRKLRTAQCVVSICRATYLINQPWV